MYILMEKHQHEHQGGHQQQQGHQHQQARHLQIDGVTALFKNSEELGVVSGFDVISGCWCWFDIVFVAVTVSMWVWVSRCKVSGRWTRLL